MADGQTQDRRSSWNFVITDAGWQWTLTRADGSEERAQKTFTTLKDAADDAIAHGYGAWRGDERRTLDDDV